MTPNNWVYLIYDPDADEIKIGQSISPEERLKALRSAQRPHLRILATMPDHSKERELHERFEHLAIGHEWHEAGWDLRLYAMKHKGRPDLNPVDAPYKPPVLMYVLSYLMFVSALVMSVAGTYAWVVGNYNGALFATVLAVLGFWSLGGMDFYTDAEHHILLLAARLQVLLHRRV